MRLLTKKQVLQKISICASSLTKLQKEANFPAPINIVSNIYRWNEDTVDNWIKNLNNNEDLENSEKKNK